MKVYVKLQGTYTKAGLEIEFEEPFTVAELVDGIGILRNRVSLVSINSRLAKAEPLVPNRAEVKFLQQMSGG